MTATNPTAPTTLTIGGLEFQVHGVLTLGQKEELRRRSLRQHDGDSGYWFCVDCLSDLPHDPYEQSSHVCAEEPVSLLAPEQGSVVHKTRTFVKDVDALTGRTDWYGRPIVLHDTMAKALCSCGWKSEWCDTRSGAQAVARYHRQNPESSAA